MIKKCNGCKKDKEIVNSHYKLCNQCNETRLKVSKASKPLQEGIYIKTIKYPLRPKETPIKQKAKKSLFINDLPNKRTASIAILEDEDFYEECFNLSDHLCEECGTQLPEEFRDENNKVAARWRYSHIIPKSIAPELRHSVSNINHLCIKCHTEWENGNKVEMSIFPSNFKKFPNFLNRLITNKLGQ